MNYSTFHDQVYSQEPQIEGAEGWIQWKGTDVCMDVHCKCGHHGHIDAEFFYFYKCPECGTSYAVGQVVKLIELNADQVAFLDADRPSLVHTDQE